MADDDESSSSGGGGAPAVEATVEEAVEAPVEAVEPAAGSGSAVGDFLSRIPSLDSFVDLSSLPSLPSEQDVRGAWDAACSSALALFGGEVVGRIDAVSGGLSDGVKSLRRQACGLKTSFVESEEWKALKAQGCFVVNQVHSYEQAAIHQVNAHALALHASSPALFWGGATLGASVMFPATRRLILRNTVGRFRSEAGVLKAAARRKEALSQSIDLQMQETKKLVARSQAAREDFLQTQKKLRDARNQLDALQGRLHRTEGEAWHLSADLQRAKGAQDVVSSARTCGDIAQKQRRLVQQEIKQIAKNCGI